VFLGPDSVGGQIFGSVVLQLDDRAIDSTTPSDTNSSQRKASLTISGQLRSAISCDPPYVSFGLIRPGQVITRTIVLKSFDPKFRFGEPSLKIQGPNRHAQEFTYKDRLETKVRRANDGKTVEIDVTLRDLSDNTRGMLQGHLLIGTGYAPKPEFDLIISGICRPASESPAGEPPAHKPVRGGF